MLENILAYSKRYGKFKTVLNTAITTKHWPKMIHDSNCGTITEEHMSLIKSYQTVRGVSESQKGCYKLFVLCYVQYKYKNASLKTNLESLYVE